MHLVEMNVLGPGGPVRHALWPRLISGEALINRPCTDDPLIGEKAKRTTAGHFGHLLERIRIGQTFRHDRQHVNADLAQGFRQKRKGLFEPELDRAIVRCR